MLHCFQFKNYLVWNMEENFSVEWKIFGMGWKKIASMKYGKIVFHSIPCPADDPIYELGFCRILSFGVQILDFKIVFLL